MDIGAGLTDPGSTSTDPSPDPGSGQISPDPPTSLPVVPTVPEDCPLNRCDLPYDVVTPPDVTLADLVSFRPARPSLEGEPAGFGVVGMPANIVAAASEQRIAGTLLGWDVTVRFVPAAFVFEYGDGGSIRSATGGTSWQRLGQAQFTPTATSHVYLARGTYPVAVTVQYSASVDFGSGNWRPVAGYVTSTTGGYDVRVVEVRTALVDETCAENPSGPGC
ncbi:hypothetical protein [Microbacterium pumilum]|uniref:hypothetical protein n=1 Tax=Microbacterium pumilum TaxID=344165 RepID=UPI0031D5D510